ncbi:MAG TPA: hypothetical protein VGK42_12095 [Candidatus Dormibacteraeota bacterium]
MSQTPGAPTVGQVSADGQFRWDGQQWAPLPRGHREATSWTRPMQLASAGLFALSAVGTLVTTLVYVNHDTVLKALKAQGTQIPAGTDVDTVVNITIASIIGFAVFFAILYLVAAVGSYMGWRWVFWGAIILFGLSGIGAVTNLASIAKPETSPIPVPGLIVDEVFSVLSLAMAVWMLIAGIKFGPWAMKRPGP